MGNPACARGIRWIKMQEKLIPQLFDVTRLYFQGDPRARHGHIHPLRKNDRRFDRYGQFNYLADSCPASEGQHSYRNQGEKKDTTQYLQIDLHSHCPIITDYFCVP